MVTATKITASTSLNYEKENSDNNRFITTDLNSNTSKCQQSINNTVNTR